MKASACNFAEARDAFLKALTDYQKATLDMSLALRRITEHSGDFYRQLDKVVRSPIIATAVKSR